MAWWQRFRYTLRICWVSHLWLLLAAMAVATTAIAVEGHIEAPARAQAWALALVEVVAPLIAMAAMSHVLTIDSDAGFSEVLRSYPVSGMRLAGERLAAGLIYVSLGMGPTVAIFAYFSVLRIGTAWSGFAPPAVFLVGLSLLAAAVASSWLAGLACGALYWLWEFSTRGDLTGAMFLFPQSLGHKTGDALLSSRVLIAAVGSALVVTSVVIYQRIFRPD